MSKDIIISISYKLSDEVVWHEFNIDVQDYYDKDYYQEIERIDINSKPIYEHAISYIPLENKELIKNTKLCIVDKNANKKIIIQESYWNFHKNSIIEKIDLDIRGSINNHEIILETLFQENSEKRCLEIMHFSKIEQTFNPTLYNYVKKEEKELITEKI